MRGGADSTRSFEGAPPNMRDCVATMESHFTWMRETRRLKVEGSRVTGRKRRETEGAGINREEKIRELAWYLQEACSSLIMGKNSLIMGDL